MMLAYLLPVGLVVSAQAFLTLRAAQIAFDRQLGSHLVAVARTVAQALARPDLELMSAQPEGSRSRQNLLGKLRNLKRASGASGILLFGRKLDAMADSSGRFERGEQVPRLRAYSMEMKRLFEGRAVSSPLFTGEDGRWYKTGFAPVVYGGKILAAVAVDGPAGYFVHLSGLQNRLVMMGVLALMLVAAVTAVVAQAITRPLGRLVLAARKIGSGDLESPVTAGSSDEIGELAATLESMRQALQQRDRQLQMMLAGIAHEVRNPLGGISLYLGLLREKLSGESDALEKLDRIAGELSYLERVVNDFLEFARDRQLERRLFGGADLVEEVAALMEPELARKGIELELDCKPVALWADHDRVKQALLNFLRNAVQASPEGGKVEIRCSPARDGEVVFEVADRGAGVPEELAERIFEPFYTTRQQGTGLGLALSRKFAQQHGGSVQYVPRQGGGSIFRLRLPAGSGNAAGSVRPTGSGGSNGSSAGD